MPAKKQLLRDRIGREARLAKFEYQCAALRHKVQLARERLRQRGCEPNELELKIERWTAAIEALEARIAHERSSA